MLWMVEIEQILECSVEGQHELYALALEAKDFLLWHDWCKSIRQAYLHCGWAGILAVFYFIITPSADADNIIWVIVGDIPPAYLSLVTCPTGETALEGYVSEMQEWVKNVRSGEAVDDVIPVYERGSFTKVTPKPDFADMLEARLKFIEDNLIPQYQEIMCTVFD